MEVVEDLRVVRGPDWAHGEEDGGEGYVGTVVKVHCTSEPASVARSLNDDREDGSAEVSPMREIESEQTGVHTVTVQWDCGHRGEYKCGEDGKFELRIFDSGQSGMQYRSVTCDGCRSSPVTGFRWKCSHCYDYDLCCHCYMNGKHHEEHRFVRYDGGLRSMPGPRKGARLVESKGIFPLAEVVRGHDWSWGQQDGGSGTVGKVTSISNWEDTHYRGSVEVEWPEEDRQNYRVGCQGMVDLKCVTPGSGGNYYPDHLPVLGAPHRPPDHSELASSDYVRMELDTEIFRMLQASHGGWNPSMEEIRGQLGVIHSIMDSGNLRVSYGPRNWVINPSAVVKADIPHYKRGDVVRVMDDLTEVVKLQKDHGGWNDAMSEAVGQLGSVQGVNNDGNVAVIMKTHLWTFNPLCLRPAEKGEEQEVSSSEVLGEQTLLLELRMQALLEREDSEVLHHAALLGNFSVIREYLEKYPNEVNAKFSGKTALHCAAAAGRMNVVETLVELGANLECVDEEGYRPLHHCAIREQSEIATVLLKAGSNPNSKSHSEQTPLILAAMRGSMKVLTVLLRWPSINLSEQDKDGDTALHCSVHGRRYQSLCALLDAGADPSLVNFHIFTPLHLAVKVGFLSAVEVILKSHPEHVNVREQQGCTPLHIAATEGELEVARTLLRTEGCMVDAKADTGHTPLHGAVMKDHSRIVELLIGYGADPTITDSDDDTPLHSALDNSDLHLPTDDTHELNKVKQSLVERTDDITGQLVVACFLIREGADHTVLNSSGQSPLEACSPEVAVIVSTFAGKYAGTGKYRGSLRTPQQPAQKFSEHTAQEMNVTVCTETDSNAGPEPIAVTDQNMSLQSSPKRLLDLTTPTGADSINKVSSQPISSITSPREAPELCFLCDEPITVRFEPCGHSTLCENCAKRARRCPECKTEVQGISQLQ